MKTQIVIIRGGNTFDTYEEYIEFLRAYQIDFERVKGVKQRWQDTLAEELGEAYEVIQPTMPSKDNAKYLEWKIWFEKHFSFLQNDLIFIGNSLGGIFLAKYLSENRLPVSIKALYLVAAPYDAEGSPYSLADFVLPKSLDLLNEQVGEIYLIQSKDDPVVKYTDVERYAAHLPNARQMLFADRGHFLQESFPEIVEKIKALSL